MAFADVGPVRLFFTDDGTGEPALLFVHGYTCDSHDWSRQIPHFVAAHRVIAVDLRGHGRSSAPDTGYTPQDFAGDLVGLLDHLGVERVVAVGHSLGGAVVGALAVEHPGRVEAMIAVDPGYLVPDTMSAQVGPVLEALQTGDPVPTVQEILGSWDAPAQPPALRTWQRRRVAGMPHHVLRQALRSLLTGLASESTSRPYLARRACPVLSFYIDPARASLEQEVFANHHSRAIAWEGAGHWLHQERPAEFNALVDSWLAGLSPAHS
jgi:pimeloyl-ACP methyl ester carboxylesterase